MNNHPISRHNDSEVLSGVQRRRHWTPEKNPDRRGDVTALHERVSVARRHGIVPASSSPGGVDRSRRADHRQKLALRPGPVRVQ